MNPNKLRTRATREELSTLQSSLDAATVHLRSAALNPVVGEGPVRAGLIRLSDRCSAHDLPSPIDVPLSRDLDGRSGSAEDFAAFHHDVMSAATCLHAAVNSGAVRTPVMRTLLDVARRISFLAFRVEEAFETALVAEFGPRTHVERFPFARPEEPDSWKLYVDRGKVRRALS